MNVREAEKQGLEFTGKWERSYSPQVDTVKEEAKAIRDNGFRAVVVTDSYGRGVYAEQRYFMSLELQDMEDLDGMYKRAKDYLENKHRQEMEELEQDYHERRERVKVLKAELGITDSHDETGGIENEE